MKKNYWFFAAAAMALAACSNDDTIAQYGGEEAINFRVLTTGMTRAADAHFNAANDAFKVSAFTTGATSEAYFTNIVFSTEDGSTFKAPNKYYWPNTKNLDFYAWAPSSLTASANNFDGIEVTPGATIGSQPDFVYGVTKGWGTYDTPAHNGKSGVALNFRHAESKVIIKIKNTNNDLVFTVGNVSIGNLRGTETFTWNGVTDGATPTAAATATTDGQYTSGTLTYLNGTWTAASAQTTAYTVAMGEDDVDDVAEGTQARNMFSGEVTTARDLTSTAANHEMILIPQVLANASAYASADAGAAFTGAYIKAQLKIQQKSNNAYIAGAADTFVDALWPLPEGTWLPGHTYTYTVDIAGGGYNPTNKDDNAALDPILGGAEIKFVTVTVDAWGADANTNIAGPTE
jgi:hypothetical protein